MVCPLLACIVLDDHKVSVNVDDFVLSTFCQGLEDVCIANDHDDFTLA